MANRFQEVIRWNKSALKRNVPMNRFLYNCRFFKGLVMATAIAFTLMYLLLCYIATAFLDFDKLIGKPVYFLATVSVLELLILTYNNLPALPYLIYSPIVMGYAIIHGCFSTYINVERENDMLIAGQRAFLLIMTAAYIGQYSSAYFFSKIMWTYFLKKPKLITVE